MISVSKSQPKRQKQASIDQNTVHHTHEECWYERYKKKMKRKKPPKEKLQTNILFRSVIMLHKIGFFVILVEKRTQTPTIESSIYWRNEETKNKHTNHPKANVTLSISCV